MLACLFSHLLAISRSHCKAIKSQPARQGLGCGLVGIPALLSPLILENGDGVIVALYSAFFMAFIVIIVRNAAVGDVHLCWDGPSWRSLRIDVQLTWLGDNEPMVVCRARNGGYVIGNESGTGDGYYNAIRNDAQ